MIFSAGGGDRMGTRVRERCVRARFAKGTIAAVADRRLFGLVQRCRVRRLRQSVRDLRRWTVGPRGGLLSGM